MSNVDSERYADPENEMKQNLMNRMALLKA